MNPELPEGWRMVTEAYGGTGNGDELFGIGLYHWSSVTLGHLWWKRTHTGWRRVGRFNTREDALDYALCTQEQLDRRRNRVR